MVNATDNCKRSTLLGARCCEAHSLTVDSPLVSVYSFIKAEKKDQFSLKVLFSTCGSNYRFVYASLWIQETPYYFCAFHTCEDSFGGYRLSMPAPGRGRDHLNNMASTRHAGEDQARQQVPAGGGAFDIHGGENAAFLQFT